jgi:hypothetical protein
MLAFLSVRAEEVTDAIVEMFDALVGRVFSRADDELTDVKAAQVQAHVDNARLFRAVAEILLDDSIPADGVRDAVFRCVPQRSSAASSTGARPWIAGRPRTSSSC